MAGDYVPPASLHDVCPETRRMKCRGRLSLLFLLFVFPAGAQLARPRHGERNLSRGRDRRGEGRYPGLASWAKFSRPFGTELGNRVLRHGLKARIAGTLCAVAFLFAGLAWGSVGGSISGVIKDPSGRVVTGAQVTARQVSTGLAYKTLSNGKGYYTFPVLPVGQYELDVQAHRFLRLSTQ